MANSTITLTCRSKFNRLTKIKLSRFSLFIGIKRANRQTCPRVVTTNDKKLMQYRTALSWATVTTVKTDH
ncbi:hypothetical protein J6590_097568, partial [Homalodisca vitripennis]